MSSSWRPTKNGVKFGRNGTCGGKLPVFSCNASLATLLLFVSVAWFSIEIFISSTLASRPSNNNFDEGDFPGLCHSQSTVLKLTYRLSKSFSIPALKFFGNLGLIKWSSTWPRTMVDSSWTLTIFFISSSSTWPSGFKNRDNTLHDNVPQLSDLLFKLRKCTFSPFHFHAYFDQSCIVCHQLKGGANNSDAFTYISYFLSRFL